MKAVVCFFALFPYLTFGQCDPAGNGSLSAEVQNNSVILRNDTVTRNCGALYTMGITWLSNDTLIWLQTDIGDAAYCFCNFNLSVTLDSLSPGDYVVKACYTQALINDTCYIGSVPFTIAQAGNYPAPEINSYWQSACYTVGTKEPRDFSSGSAGVFPNPAGDRLFLKTDLDKKGTIQLFNLNGRLILETEFNKPLTEIGTGNLRRGVYLIKVIGSKGMVVNRFIKE
ncbi:MAG: T9SS type A sorting domain-containing protein [Bacteroidota bacterium]